MGNDPEALGPKQSNIVGESTNQDAVFGEMTEDGPNYRSVRCLVISHMSVLL